MARSYLRTYFTLLFIFLLTVGFINFTVDPLWLNRGNQLTGYTLPTNERIAKTNLLLKASVQTYDCFILGTSRLTLLNESSLQENRCFNYSFSKGSLEEFLAYARFVKERGFNPNKVYIEIIHTPAEKTLVLEGLLNSEEQEIVVPKPDIRPYLFSLDTLWTSIKAILLQYPNLSDALVDYHQRRLYDHNFHGVVSSKAPQYKPKLTESVECNTCAATNSYLVQEIRDLFPSAEFVGIIPPLSVWYVYNESYSQGLSACQLRDTYQAAQYFDRAYDFSIPSAITTRTDNTYDGNHYEPQVFNQITNMIERDRLNFGILINDYSLDEYRELYLTKLEDFLGVTHQQARM